MGGSEGSHLQTRSPSLALMPREFPPFKAPLLVMALEMGWSTKLAWKPATFWTGLKFSVARRKSSAKSVALLAKVAVPKSWLLIGESLVEYAITARIHLVYHAGSRRRVSNVARWCRLPTGGMELPRI